MSEFSFRSISLERMDRILPNFVYGLILTRSKFGLLPIIFHKFAAELMQIEIFIHTWPFNLVMKSAEGGYRQIL